MPLSLSVNHKSARLTAILNRIASHAQHTQYPERLSTPIHHPALLDCREVKRSEVVQIAVAYQNNSSELLNSDAPRWFRTLIAK